MIEPDINERMARFSPSQVQDDLDPIASEIASRAAIPTSQPTMAMPDVDPVAAQIAEKDTESLDAAVLGARAVNPDEAARAIKVGRKVGIPAEVARADMQRAEQQAYLSDLRSKDFLRTDPVMANFLANKEFAETAHDDIDVLGTIRPFMLDYVQFYVTGMTPGMRRGFERGQLVAERGEIGGRAMAGLAQPEDFERATKIRDRMRELVDVGFLGATTEVIAQNLAQIRGIGTFTVGGAAVGSAMPVLGTIAGGALGATAGVVATTGQMEAGNLYLDLREEGVEDDVAIPVSVAGGFLNGVIEVVGMKIAAKPFQALAKRFMAEAVSKAVAQPTTRAALAAAGKGYILQVGTEASEEALQEVVIIAGEEIAKAASGIDSETGLRQATERVVDAFVQGAMGSAILGGIGPGANLYVDLSRAANTERQQVFFEKLATAGKDSRLAKRSPEAYERFLEAQAKDGPAETIYVDGRTAQELFAQSGLTAAQLEEVLPGIKAQVDEAVATGGDVTIQTARFGARLANTDLGNALLPHMRLDPDAMSLTEAQEFQARRQEIVKDAERILTEKESASGTFVQEAREIEDTLASQIQATGQMDERAARSSAQFMRDFYVTQAASMGLTPKQVYERFPVRVEGEGMAAPAAPLEQSARSQLQTRASQLGIPATTSNAAMQRDIDILTRDPKTWSREDFDAVKNLLAIHQDVRPGAAERSESIMREGLRSGMVDSIAAMEEGRWTWAGELVGGEAYVFPYGTLRFRSKDDPNLAAGNIPLFKITPKRGQNLYEAIKESAVLNLAGIPVAPSSPLEQAATLDADYLAAVERGDMATAQRMVDEAARASGLTEIVWRGDRNAAQITEYRRGARREPGIFTTTNQDVADKYANKEGGARRFYVGGRTLDLTQPTPEAIAWIRKWAEDGEWDFVDRSTGESVSPEDAVLSGRLYDWEGTWSGRRWKDIQESAAVDGYDIVKLLDEDKDAVEGTFVSTVVLNENKIKLADPVTRDDAGNVVPLSRRFDITSPKLFEQAAMSTRVPTAVKPIEDALNDVLLADFPAFLRDEKFVAKNLAKFKELNAPVRIDESATEQQQLEQIIEHMKSNLLWLHDAMDPAIRDRARMWYVGGRRLVDWLSERHGMSPMQAATVFAVLSPQKNWYENVGLGIRIIDIVATQSSAAMDAEMRDAYLSSLRKDVTKKQGQLDKHDAAKPKRGKKAAEEWQKERDEIAALLDAASAKVVEAQRNIDAIGDRTLSKLLEDRDFFLAAIMVRWFDQTKNDRTYPVISPEGGVGSPMLTDAGIPASIRYGSYNEVAKAIAAYVDGRAENVHFLIGAEHKVRNFYNNLFNPADPRFATIDTHAIAAAYLMPLAGTDKLVAHGLGGGVGNAMFGLGGGYAVFYEAYRRAAEARGIEPREMQSITWEAIRGMFEAAMKGGLKAPVAATWKRYVDGEIGIDEARADVMQRAGGITMPSWVALPTDMQPGAGYEGVSRTAADAQAKRFVAQPTAASVMFEVAPDPANTELVSRWESLTPQLRQEISVRVAEDIIPNITQEFGIAADMVMQVGGWEGSTNVGFALKMPPGPLVRQVAQAVGQALSQQAVFTLSASEFQGSEAADIVVLRLQPGTTVEDIGNLYETKLFPLGIQGHATVEDSMIISLNPGVDGAVLARTISDALAGDGRVVEITHDTGWRSLDETRIPDEAARAADEGRRAQGAPGRRRVDAYRREATRLVAQYLEEAGRYEQAAVGPARGGFDPRRLTTILNKTADLSTFLHESAHAFLTFYEQVAQMPDAPARIVNDLDEVLRWAGIAGDTPQARLATWNGMTLDQKRKAHEQFAYSFEVYLFEGKAPSAEMQGLFERFSAWLKRVYRSIRDDLNAIYRREFGEDLPILTGEVRQVMDRMLATDEQIARQAAINEMKPMFQTQAESGMSDAEWAAYQQMQQEAIEASVIDMNVASMRQMQWLGNARSRVLREVQKKHDARRKEVAVEIAAEVKVEPVYRAMTYLRTGKFIDADGAEVAIDGPHRLDTKRVKKLYETVPTAASLKAVRATGMPMPAVIAPDIAKLGTGKNGMMGVDGLDPDLVAETFGYSSGDEMIRALIAARPMKEIVAERTDAEMLRRFGDMTSPEAIEVEVQAALHNEARARFVAVELRYLSKATEPARVMVDAAKQVARDLIAGKRVRDVRPSDFVAAEARAARDASRIGSPVDAVAVGRAAYTRIYNERIAAGADEATAVAEATTASVEAARMAQERTEEIKARYGADPEQARIRAKRAQLYQNQLAAEALRVKAEVDKQVKYLRRVLRDENVKRMGAQAADQVAGLLDRFEVAAVSLKRLDERKALTDWLAEQEAAGLVPDIAPEIANEARRVNYREMKVSEFRDLVDAVKQIEHVGKNERNMRLAEERAAFEEVRDNAVTRIRASGKVRGLSLDPRTPLTGIGRAAAFLRGFAAQHLKAASIVRVLDGGKEDGPLWNAIIRTANEAADFETRRRAESSLKFGEILKPVFALGGMGGKGMYFPSIGRSLNREARVAIASNMGNDGNRQRLLDGEGWTLEQVQPVLESLTEAEWQAVQQMWDFVDSYRPEIAAKERRLYGKEPEWVTPVPFTVRTSDGKEVSLQGGYYPIKYDPVASDRVATVDAAEEAKRDLQGAYTAATTRRSFVKARAKEVVDRPILYTLDAAFSGVNDVIHDLAWHEWLISTNRLLRDVKFANAVRETRGPEFLKNLRDWTKDNATGGRGQQVAGEAAVSWIRQGISASRLGFNINSAALQILGFNQSIVRVGAKYIGQGITQFVTSPFDSAKMVADKSQFMAERGRTQFREINEIKNRVRGQTEISRRVFAGTYFLMMNMQRSVDIPTWLGAYQKALDAGKYDAVAVSIADQSVRDAQGSGLVSDLSAVERGGPYTKLFTVFYSYMNTVYNMAAVQTMTARSKGKLAADYAMLFVVPVVFGYALKSLLQPNTDDEEFDPEALARKLAAEELSYMMGTMVIAREFGGAAQLLTGAEGVRMGYGGPAGLAAIGDVYTLSAQAGQLEFDRAFRRAAVNTLGAFTGLPAAQINRTIDGIEAVVEGEVEGVGAVVAPFTGVQR